MPSPTILLLGRASLVLCALGAPACQRPKAAPPSPLRTSRLSEAPPAAATARASEPVPAATPDAPPKTETLPPTPAASEPKTPAAEPAVESLITSPRAAIFNGRSLAGWTQAARHEGDATWLVEEGALTGRPGTTGGGRLLHTAKTYGEFDFACDFRLDEPVDSGLFLRMAPGERGIELTLDATPEGEPEGEIGGLDSDGRSLARTPGGVAHFKQGDWNRLELSARGPNATALLDLVASLNGEPLLAHAIPPNTIGIAPAGMLALEVDGGPTPAPGARVRFRNVLLRELDTPATESFLDIGEGRVAPSARGYREGWRPMFDGRTLEGWELYGEHDGVRVAGGLIEITSGNGGELRSVGDYENFELVLDFKTSALANSGVFLRATRDDENPAFSGCEVQILDDRGFEAASKTALEPWQFTGGVFGSIAPATRDAVRPAGAWNTYRIRYVGSRLSVELNGMSVVDADTHAVEADPPFASRAKKGFIGLQRQGSAAKGSPSFVWFRNVFVRRLDAQGR